MEAAPAVAAATPVPHASVPPSPNCVACGAANPMRFRFCAACGSPIALPVEAGDTARSRSGESASRTAPPTAEPRRALPDADAAYARTRSPAPPPTAEATHTDAPTGPKAGGETRLRGMPMAAAVVPERPSLRLTRLGRDGRELGQNVVYETFDVGRTEGNLVLPEDPTLSPRHARILRSGTHWQLADLRSSNGTFLRLRNEPGVESREGLRLAHGTTFWVGHQLLRFEILGRTALGPARLDDDTLSAGVDDSDVRARVIVCSRAQLSLDTVYVRGEFVIGREIGHMVFPSDGYMSRRHAVIRQEDGQGTFRLYDLGSSNGTFVRIQGDAELVHRDQFRVGDQVFRAELSTTLAKDSP